MNQNRGVIPDKPPSALPVKEWRRTTAGIHVSLVWGYDTVAILDDYYA